MSRSVVRACFLALTVFVFSCFAFAVIYVIATPAARDGAQSPSQLAHSAYDPKEEARVSVAGDVVSCHSANDGTVLVYALADEQGHAPDLVFVRYPADGRLQHEVGERVAFSGTRTGRILIEATTDLLRPPL